MTQQMKNMYWLEKYPEDIQNRVLSAKSYEDLSALLRFNLDENHLVKISKKIQDFKKKCVSIGSFREVNIAILSNATIDLICPILMASALRHGIVLTVHAGGFDQIRQDISDSNSFIYGDKVNAILLALDYRALQYKPTLGATSDSIEMLSYCFKDLEQLVNKISQHTNAHIWLQNFANLPFSIFGSYESYLPGTQQWLVNNLNPKLGELISDQVKLLDISALANSVGLENWHDATAWHLAKIPFSYTIAPLYADYILRAIGASLGKSKRCLVLDLDNTLWGGIIGDDGLNGILLGNGDPTGEAYLDLQKLLLQLRERGIVLCVSSKNEDSNARLPFQEHPDMVLKEGHIAIFRANWSDKASNIRLIAKSLSLGLDSIVFLDDNPAERLLVRTEIPELAVPELPDNPALYPATLISAGYFEAVNFSTEDSNRASLYQKNMELNTILENSSDIDAYLKSLQMKISLKPFDEIGRKRIAQLISKSNQFNLTSKRYSEIEIKQFEADKNYFTLQVRLNDILGDNGMIEIVICKIEGDTWHIDSWLMSCRVLKRRVEEITLKYIVNESSKSGAKQLLGYYIPTNRNKLVENHYESLGFCKQSHSNQITVWRLDLENYSAPDLPFDIIDAI